MALSFLEAYDGGAFGLSNRYASGFLWLNKLGLAAEHNYKVNVLHKSVVLIKVRTRKCPDAFNF